MSDSGGTVVMVVVVVVVVDVVVEVDVDVDDVGELVVVVVEVGVVLVDDAGLVVVVVSRGPCSDGPRVATTMARTIAVTSTATDSTTSTPRCQGSRVSRNDRIGRGYRSARNRGTRIAPTLEGGQ
jgi:hypothetical protein